MSKSTVQIVQLEPLAVRPKQVAAKLNIRPDTLQKAVWLNRVEAPIKAPSDAFLWTDKDIQRASWALLHRAYQPEQKGRTDE